MKESWIAPTTSIFSVIKIKKHLSQIGCNILLQACITIVRQLWSKARRKFAAAQIGHIVALASFDTSLELVTIFGFVLLNAGSYHDTGRDSVRNITEAKGVTLRAVLIGIIAILASKMALC